jgi:hypothetical protein
MTMVGPHAFSIFTQAETLFVVQGDPGIKSMGLLNF